MSIESYFVTVPVSSHCIIDPVLKLRISTGRWEPDPSFRGGSIWIEMEFDPEIEPGRLTMAPSASLVASSKLLGNEPPNEVAFKSSRSVGLAEFMFHIDQLADEVMLLLGNLDASPSFEASARLIERSGADGITHQPLDILEYMLKSLPLLPVWEKEYGRSWESKRISIYIHSALAAQFARRANTIATAGSEKMVKLASREI